MRYDLENRLSRAGALGRQRSLLPRMRPAGGLLPLRRRYLRLPLLVLAMLWLCT